MKVITVKIFEKDGKIHATMGDSLLRTGVNIPDVLDRLSVCLWNDFSRNEDIFERFGTEEGGR